jgi:hypothetical protein
MFSAVPLNVVRRVRAWPDQTHFTAKNVPELRKFIEAVATEKAARASQPGIVFDFEERTFTLVA